MIHMMFGFSYIKITLLFSIKMRNNDSVSLHWGRQRERGRIFLIQMKIWYLHPSNWVFLKAYYIQLEKEMVTQGFQGIASNMNDMNNSCLQGTIHILICFPCQWSLLREPENLSYIFMLTNYVWGSLTHWPNTEEQTTPLHTVFSSRKILDPGLILSTGSCLCFLGTAPKWGIHHRDTVCSKCFLVQILFVK